MAKKYKCKNCRFETTLRTGIVSHYRISHPVVYSRYRNETDFIDDFVIPTLLIEAAVDFSSSREDSYSPSESSRSDDSYSSPDTSSSYDSGSSGSSDFGGSSGGIGD